MTSYSECEGEFGWEAKQRRIAARALLPGEPCGLHPGCLNHWTKPCEGCGRIAGRYPRTEGDA